MMELRRNRSSCKTFPLKVFQEASFVMLGLSCLLRNELKMMHLLLMQLQSKTLKAFSPENASGMRMDGMPDRKDVKEGK